MGPAERYLHSPAQHWTGWQCTIDSRAPKFGVVLVTCYLHLYIFNSLIWSGFLLPHTPPNQRNFRRRHPPVSRRSQGMGVGVDSWTRRSQCEEIRKVKANSWIFGPEICLNYIKVIKRTSFEAQDHVCCVADLSCFTWLYGTTVVYILRISIIADSTQSMMCFVITWQAYLMPSTHHCQVCPRNGFCQKHQLRCSEHPKAFYYKPCTIGYPQECNPCVRSWGNEENN